ncbi:hypothetical protein B0H13DRAFT_2315795 [Mycena leptocephala]|nr:hypothetical protein B0H13DRAFT_2315795 [Mycena leptocephala]
MFAKVEIWATILALAVPIASGLQIQTVSGNAVSEGSLLVTWTSPSSSDPTTFDIQLRNTIPVAGFPVSLITGVVASSLTTTVNLPDLVDLSGPSSGWFIQFFPMEDQNGTPFISRSEEFSMNTTIGGTQSVTVRALVIFTALSSNLWPHVSAVLCILNVVCVKVVNTCIILILYAGAVVGGLIVVLAVVGLFIYRARHRRQTRHLLPVANPMTREAPTSSQLVSTFASGRSPPTEAVSRGVLAMQEKARYAARLEQEIRDLAEQIEAPGAGQPDHTNAHLLEEIRVLRTQMSAQQQQLEQMQAALDVGLPEYTPGPT